MTSDSTNNLKINSNENSNENSDENSNEKELLTLTDDSNDESLLNNNFINNSSKICPIIINEDDFTPSQTTLDAFNFFNDNDNINNNYSYYNNRWMD